MGLAFQGRQISSLLQKEFYIPQVGMHGGSQKEQVIWNENCTEPLTSSDVATQLATNEDWQIVLAGYRI